MSDVLTLAAEMRTEFGKGFARRARMAGKIPAVLYGHGSDPVHVFLPGHETMMALKHSNALLTIMVEGKPALTIAKDIQKDYVRRTIAHLDLLIVKKGEKITVDVPLHLTGEPFPGCVAVLEHTSVSVSAEATHLPERFEISVEGLTDGQHVSGGEAERGHHLVEAGGLVDPERGDVEPGAPADRIAHAVQPQPVGQLDELGV